MTHMTRGLKSHLQQLESSNLAPIDLVLHPQCCPGCCGADTRHNANRPRQLSQEARVRSVPHSLSVHSDRTDFHGNQFLSQTQSVDFQNPSQLHYRIFKCLPTTFSDRRSPHRCEVGMKFLAASGIWKGEIQIPWVNKKWTLFFAKTQSLSLHSHGVVSLRCVYSILFAYLRFNFHGYYLLFRKVQNLSEIHLNGK